MLDILLNALMVLGIIFAVVLSAIILIVGVVVVLALCSKFIEIGKGDKPKNGGR